MRGEESALWSGPHHKMELPPHARRRESAGNAPATVLGITSACAEKSRVERATIQDRWNYLRMRGEEVRPHNSVGRQKELPPHARRRARICGVPSSIRGITSACAEKSNIGGHGTRLTWNYLRMRGEEDSDAGAAVIRRELPPHARRRVQLVGGRAYMLGITSACAEKRILTRARL